MKTLGYKQLALICGLICISLLSLACSSGGVASMIQASGVPGEVMLVMNGADFESIAARHLRETLEYPDPAMPQEEAMLHVTSSVPMANFSSITRRARSIVLVNVNKEVYTTTAMHPIYNEWAKGQIILQINTPSLEDLDRFVTEQGELIRSLIIRHELYRLSEGTAGQSSGLASRLTDSVLGYTIEVPRDITHSKTGENFVWMSNAQIRKRRDLLVYSFPYSGKQDLEPQRLIEVRDSVLKANIEGGVEGSYPGTAPWTIFFRKVNTPEGVRSELRGLWEMKAGAAMGGPFVQQALLDKEKGRVIVAESFVYNPNDKKVDLLRMMEAGLYSLRPSAVKTFDAESILKTSYSSTKTISPQQ